MSNILDICIYLLHYVRNSGTTTLLRQINTSNKLWIVCSSSSETLQFGENGLNLASLDRVKISELEKRPILFEASTIMYLIQNWSIIF